MIDWAHTVVEMLGISTPIIVYLAANKHSAKQENEKRHEENKRRLDELLGERQYLKPHDHIETEGTLMAEGIIRKRNGA